MSEYGKGRGDAFVGGSQEMCERLRRKRGRGILLEAHDVPRRPHPVEVGRVAAGERRDQFELVVRDGQPVARRRRKSATPLRPGGRRGRRPSRRARARRRRDQTARASEWGRRGTARRPAPPVRGRTRAVSRARARRPAGAARAGCQDPKSRGRPSPTRRRSRQDNRASLPPTACRRKGDATQKESSSMLSWISCRRR